MAGEVFRNVQILKAIPVDEFMGTMGFFSASTGLNCTDCHREESGGDWARYADDNDLKRTARRMMLVVDAINRAQLRRPPSGHLQYLPPRQLAARRHAEPQPALQRAADR